MIHWFNGVALYTYLNEEVPFLYLGAGLPDLVDQLSHQLRQLVALLRLNAAASDRRRHGGPEGAKVGRLAFVLLSGPEASKSPAPGQAGHITQPAHRPGKVGVETVAVQLAYQDGHQAPTFRVDKEAGRSSQGSQPCDKVHEGLTLGDGRHNAAALMAKFERAALELQPEPLGEEGAGGGSLLAPAAHEAVRHDAGKKTNIRSSCTLVVLQINIGTEGVELVVGVHLEDFSLKEHVDLFLGPL